MILVGQYFILNDVFYLSVFYRPYPMDLGSTTGAFINVHFYIHTFHFNNFKILLFMPILFFLQYAVLLRENLVEPHPYYKLFERDNFKFNKSSRYGHENFRIYCLPCCLKCFACFGRSH
jgi:hypothetical protein